MINFANLNLFVSSALFGIIWIVQILVYPNFLFIKAEHFKVSMKHHQQRISWVIVPLMLLELALSIFDVFQSPSLMNQTVLALVVLIWTMTFTLQVPLHAELLQLGYNEEKIKRLVQTNWARTFCWSAKLILIFLY